MRYSGSKAKIAKYIIPFIMEELKEGYTYVEPFMGGCNILSEIDWPKKVGADSNGYVVALWNNLKIIGDALPLPKEISEDEYKIMKELAEKGSCSVKYPRWLIGYAGNACSYGSAWFNGYAHFNEKRGENHIEEAYNGFWKQAKSFKNLQGTWFHRSDYKDLFSFYYHAFALSSSGSNKYVFYCDPPYRGTKGYGNETFNHDEFWEWVRRMSKVGFKVLVSEYEAPDDFKCIWEFERKDGMGTTKCGCKQNTRIERLFVYDR